jgi:hypothetical protein
MHLRKHNLLVLGYILLASHLPAQVNSRDPGRSPDFQTTLDEEVNNERVAKAVPANEPTPAPSTPAVAAPVATNVENSKLSVDQIIQNAIRRDEELRELREEYTYQLKLVTQRLDDDNKVIPDKTKTVTAKIKPGKDITFSADFNDDSKDNDSTPQKTTYAGATGGRGIQSKQKKSDDDDDSNKDVEDAKKVNAMLDMGKIAPRFKYVRMPDQTLRDRPCFVIKFSPKSDQPFNSREEKVINKVGGLIWIDQNDFSIIQTKGKLTEEVDVAWFLATMKGMDFNYETSELSSINIPVPSGFFMSFDLNIMGYRMAQKQVSQMTDYQPATPSSATPPAPTTPPSGNP